MYVRWWAGRHFWCGGFCGAFAQFGGSVFPWVEFRGCGGGVCSAAAQCWPVWPPRDIAGVGIPTGLLGLRCPDGLLCWGGRALCELSPGGGRRPRPGEGRPPSSLPRGGPVLGGWGFVLSLGVVGVWGWPARLLGGRGRREPTQEKPARSGPAEAGGRSSDPDPQDSPARAATPGAAVGFPRLMAGSLRWVGRGAGGGWLQACPVG
jgi:hypothetical protein